jgi:hypothetical protein
MLPNFSALDLRRRVAPTGAGMGLRAIERRIRDFKDRFRNYAAGSPLTNVDGHFMDTELDNVRDTLTTEGPAELALLRAIRETEPNADGDVVVDFGVAMLAQEEFADKEIQLYVLREVWKLKTTQSHLARKMIERNVIEAIVRRLAVQMFADDLRAEALSLLHDLTSESTGNFLIRWSLVHTEKKADAFVPLVCSFLKESDLKHAKYAMSLLSTLTSGDNGIDRDYDMTDEAAVDAEADDLDWGYKHYHLTGDDKSLFDDDPYSLARDAIQSTDGAFEKVLAASEMVMVQQDQMYTGVSSASIRMEVSSAAISTLEDVLYNRVDASRKFIDHNGPERIMRVFYWLSPTLRLRASYLQVVHECLDMWEPQTEEAERDSAKFQAILVRLFGHWRQLKQTTPPDQLVGESELWAIMQDVASLSDPLKNILLQSDDCYQILRDASDSQWNPGPVGDAFRNAKMEQAYGILFNVLTEPTTWEMWGRFLEKDRNIYWAESILFDMWPMNAAYLDALPSWKLRLVSKMLEKADFLDVCMARLSDSVMRKIVTPFVYNIYKGRKIPGNGYKNALTTLASNGMLWNTISKHIEKHEEDEDWGVGNWSPVVGVLNDDDVLMQAATSDPYPSPVAALVLLHKLNEAHEELLSNYPLSEEKKTELERRQKQYEPVLKEIENKHVGNNEQYGAILKNAVAFARKLLFFPSLENPHQDAAREEYRNKRRRLQDEVQDASTSTDPPTNTGASVGAGAAFVSLLAYVSR